MTPSDDLSFSSETFSGTVRLFPLPNLVVFPHVMQPLHIFEPRYRAMLEEALEGDGLIAMAVLAPGWEPDYEGRPPLRPTACLCRVATHHRTSEGTYNVLLLGLKRIEITRELPPDKMFREAEARLIDDEYPEEMIFTRQDDQQRLLELFQQTLPQMPEGGHQLESLLGKQIPLGMLTDIVAYTLDLPGTVKERLLSEPNVARRVNILFETLSQDRAGIGQPAFPPPFSDN